MSRPGYSGRIIWDFIWKAIATFALAVVAIAALLGFVVLLGVIIETATEKSQERDICKKRAVTPQEYASCQ